MLGNGLWVYIVIGSQGYIEESYFLENLLIIWTFKVSWQLKKYFKVQWQSKDIIKSLVQMIY